MSLSFVHPYFLLLLLVVIAGFVFLFVFSRGSRIPFSRSLLDGQKLRHPRQKRLSTILVVSQTARLLCPVFIVLAIAAPEVHRRDYSFAQTAQPVTTLFVLQSSPSMKRSLLGESSFFAQSRQAISLLSGLSQIQPSALLSYGSRPVLEIPFSNDPYFFSKRLLELRSRPGAARPSALEDGINVMLPRLLALSGQGHQAQIFVFSDEISSPDEISSLLSPALLKSLRSSFVKITFFDFSHALSTAAFRNDAYASYVRLISPKAASSFVDQNFHHVRSLTSLQLPYRYRIISHRLSFIFIVMAIASFLVDWVIRKLVLGDLL